MSNKPTTIYVVRHAQSGFNVGMDMKDYDSALTEIGKQQTKQLSDELKVIDFAVIYSSGLKRSKETAEILSNDRNLEVHIDDSTNERSVYIYAEKIGIEYADLEERITNEMKDLSGDQKMKFKYTPEMESAEEGAKRLENLFKKIANTHVGKTVLVISHGNLMRSFLTYIEYCEYDDLPTGAVKNTSYFILKTDGEKFDLKETHGIEKQKGKIRIW